MEGSLDAANEELREISFWYNDFLIQKI
jgi:hypothetical protein